MLAMQLSAVPGQWRALRELRSQLQCSLVRGDRGAARGAPLHGAASVASARGIMPSNSLKTMLVLAACALAGPALAQSSFGAQQVPGQTQAAVNPSSFVGSWAHTEDMQSTARDRRLLGTTPTKHVGSGDSTPQRVHRYKGSAAASLSWVSHSMTCALTSPLQRCVIKIDCANIREHHGYDDPTEKGASGDFMLVRMTWQ
jgi:hypothetical protein